MGEIWGRNGAETAVLRVASVGDKVDIHASQYHLTGVVVHSGHFSLVRHAHPHALSFRFVLGAFSEPLRDGFGWLGRLWLRAAQRR